MQDPNKVNDGGPAFPQGTHGTSQTLGCETYHQYEGMSLRAYIATKIMPAFSIKGFTPEGAAVAAVIYADALVAELQKGGADDNHAD